MLYGGSFLGGSVDEEVTHARLSGADGSHVVAYNISAQARRLLFKGGFTRSLRRAGYRTARDVRPLEN